MLEQFVLHFSQLVVPHWLIRFVEMTPMIMLCTIFFWIGIHWSEARSTTILKPLAYLATLGKGNVLLLIAFYAFVPGALLIPLGNMLRATYEVIRNRWSQQTNS